MPAMALLMSLALVPLMAAAFLLLMPTLLTFRYLSLGHRPRYASFSHIAVAVVIMIAVSVLSRIITVSSRDLARLIGIDMFIGHEQVTSSWGAKRYGGDLYSIPSTILYEAADGATADQPTGSTNPLLEQEI